MFSAGCFHRHHRHPNHSANELPCNVCRFLNTFCNAVRTQIIQPPVDTTVLLGLTASLQCKVSSDASVPYNIDWYREGHANAISNSQRIGVQSDGTLELQAVRASDVGIYACVVTSPGGNETRSARLSVIELPFPPTNVKVERLESANQRSINISWTAGFDGNSPILKFIIQRREVSELGKCQPHTQC